VSQDANPVMTFPIKKRINTEQFLDITVALYKVDGRIDQECGEGGQPLIRRLSIKVPKDAGRTKKRQPVLK